MKPLLAVTLTASALLVGCGGDDEPAAAPSTQAPAPVVTTTQPSPSDSDVVDATLVPTALRGLGMSSDEWKATHTASGTPNGYGPLLTTAYDTEPTYLWLGGDKVLGYDRYFTAGTDLEDAQRLILNGEFPSGAKVESSTVKGRCLVQVIREPATERALGKLDGVQLVPSVYYYSSPADDPFSQSVVWRAILGFSKPGQFGEC